MKKKATSKLRVGFIFDSKMQPAWVHSLVEGVRAASYSELAYLAVLPPVSIVKKNKGARTLLFRLYSKLDALVFSKHRRALEMASLEQEYAAFLRMTPGDESGISELRSQNADVVFSIGAPDLSKDGKTLARCGVWTFVAPEQAHAGDALRGFAELSQGLPMVSGALMSFFEPNTPPRHLSRCTRDICSYSLSKNAGPLCEQFSNLAFASLQELYENGDIPRTGVLYDSSLGRRAPGPVDIPSNREVGRFLLGLAFKIVRKILYKSDFFWFVAYGKHDARELCPDPRHFHKLIPPKDRFWADPFLVDKDGEQWLFVEELLYARGIAHLAAFRVGPELLAKHAPLPVKVLETEYHLSYPFVFEWENTWYMLPETMDNNSIELYRCVAFPSEWVLEKVLMDNVRAVDTNLVQIRGQWWMFTSMADAGGYGFDERLCLFYAQSPLGPWIPHKQNPVKIDPRCARGAGKLFERNGAWFRPAQDCSEKYGHQVVLFEILELTPEKYAEREVCAMQPEWEEHLEGTHTLNSDKEQHVVDAYTIGYAPRFFPQKSRA